MEFHLLPIIALVSLVVAASHAALPTEVYWNSVLPNTPMPKAIRDILRPDVVEDKGTAVDVGKGGVNVNTGKGGGTTVNVGKGGVNVNTGKGGGTTVSVGKGGVNVNTGKGGGTTVAVGKGSGVNVHGGKKKPGDGTAVGVGVGVGHKGTHVNVGVHGKGKKISPFLYNYAATENQLHDNPNVALFFLEKNMQPGMKMELHFIKDSDQSPFLTRQVANSIPFSSRKIPEILSRFFVNSESEEAETIKETIKECEEPGIQGEEKYCATSLEAMIDFSTSKLGKSVEVVSTEVEKETQKQQYTITAMVKKPAGDKAVVCHKQSYPYAVFYCHKSKTTRTYRALLTGADGSNVNAVAVCHTDTSAWNPKHLAFQVLKVKPGTVPVCHFLPEDHVVWVPK